MIVCPRCGHENSTDSKFCSNCGNALTGIASVAPEAETVAEGPATSGTAAPTPDLAAPATPPSPPMRMPPIPEPRTWSPRPPAGPNDPSSLPASAPEWRMSDAGPLPEPRGRRRWLWIVLGILGACLLLCVALTIWGNSDAGTRVLNDLATSLAEAATPRAEGTETPAVGE